MIIALMMKAANACEMSLNFCQITWRNTPDDSHFSTKLVETRSTYEGVQKGVKKFARKPNGNGAHARRKHR